jgi:hypothetical protein
MDKLAEIVQQLPAYVAAVVGILTALIGLFMLIPGDQPEKALQGVVDFIEKFSKK